MQSRLITRELSFSVSEESLTDLQSTACDLYERGLNVFPIKKASKDPFIVRPLFTSRMHHCTPACTHSGRVDFAPLFERANLALMTGRTSENLLAVDCDSSPAFQAIGKELDARGLAYWAFTSHRGGAYLLRLAEGEAANQAEGQTPFENVQVWGNSHYVVIPPSIHPAGTVYTWTKDPGAMPKRESLQAVRIEDLHWLGAKLAKENRPKWQEPDLFGMPAWAGKLSLANRKAFQGVAEGQRNYRLSRLAYDMAGNDIPYHEAEKAILTAAANCQPPYTGRETLAILKSAYSKVRYPSRKPTKESTGGPVKDWQKAESFARAFDWRGTFGRRALTREAVYLACIARARLDNSAVFRASVRETSELANTSSKATQDSLRDLCAAGLIKWVGKSRQTEANLYVFILPDDSHKPDTVIPTCSNSVSSLQYPKTEAEQNVFSKLGVRAWQVWHYLLLHDAKSSYKIAKETGIPESSVHRALNNLIGTFPQLVKYSQAEGVYYGEPVTDQTLQRMAADYGINRVESRRETYQLERELLVNRKVERARARQEKRTKPK